MSRYVIGGGLKGRERLRLMSEVLLPTTSKLLDTVGLTSGMSCLDVGCGGGFVTFLMAGMVGPAGKVVGTDMDEVILRLAREESGEAKLDQVEFHPADALAGQFEGEFDLVYARFLLTHLNEPEKCLEGMLKACRPGGAVVIEDIDFTGSFCHPPTEAYERYTDLYQRVVYRRGGDPNIGPKLPGMLRRIGADEIRVNVVQPTHIEGDGKLIAAITLDRIADSLVAEELATAEEVDEIVTGLNKAAADPETIMSLPRIFQVWGRK